MANPQETPHSRRSLLKRLSNWAAALLTSGGLLDSITVKPKWPTVTHPTARIPGLPEPWEAARIAVLTDLHAGPLCGPDYLRRVVAIANAASPDIAVLIGDHVSRIDALTPALTRILAALHAPAGRFAVLGNHDRFCGSRRVTAALREAGIDVLTNAHRLLDRRGAKLCIAGVDDLHTGRPDLLAALAGADPAAPRILLAHNPDFAELLPPEPRVDLMLCGHTHGGQIRLPLGRAPYVPIRHRKYIAGMVSGPRCPVYVSRGIGMVFVPLRLNCRPELPVVTLRRA